MSLGLPWTPAPLPGTVPLLPAGEKHCEPVQFQPHTVNTLACPLLSNLATRLWLHNGVPINASASCRVLSTGDLLLVGSQQELGEFQCWSLEEGFRQLEASYCPEVAGDPVADRADRSGSVPVIINTSRVSAPAGGKASWGADKSRSEERRVGKECLRLCRSRWSPYH